MKRVLFTISTIKVFTGGLVGRYFNRKEVVLNGR